MKGTFTISLDTELAWGWIDSPKRKLYDPLFRSARENVDRLLELFDKYNIPATWAVVGKMIDYEGASESHDRFQVSDFYPGLDSRSLYSNSDLHNEHFSLLLFPEVIDKIRNSRAAHEIGAHSYSHIVFTSVSEEHREIIDKDLSRMVTSLKAYGISPDSFVFPRNKVGHLDLLKSYGFKRYRDKDPILDHKTSILDKLLNNLIQILPISPQVGKAEYDANGLIKIPGGLLFRQTHLGLKKNIPISLTTAKAIMGLKSAYKKNGIFHLWFHPFNFGTNTEKHFKAFEKVLSKASTLRAQDKLEIKTMNQINP